MSWSIGPSPGMRGGSDTRNHHPNVEERSMTLPSKTTTDLAALAGRINEAHDRAESAFRSAVEHAIEAGRLLVEAKGEVPHGGWLAWVRDNCSFSERTAR